MISVDPRVVTGTVSEVVALVMLVACLYFCRKVKREQRIAEEGFRAEIAALKDEVERRYEALQGIVREFQRL